MFILTTSPLIALEKKIFPWRFIFSSSLKWELIHSQTKQTETAAKPKKKYQPRHLNFTLFNR